MPNPRCPDFGRNETPSEWLRGQHDVKFAFGVQIISCQRLPQLT